MTRKLVFAVTCSLALVAAGCGGDDGGSGGGGDVSDEAQPYVDALATNLRSNEPGELALDDGQADCVAPQWIDIAQVDRLEEAGINPSDLEADADEEIADLSLSEDEARQMVGVLGDCDLDLREEFLNALGDDDSLTEPQQTCLADAIDDQLIEDFLVATISQDDPLADPELTERFAAAAGPCEEAG